MRNEEGLLPCNVRIKLSVWSSFVIEYVIHNEPGTNKWIFYIFHGKSDIPRLGGCSIGFFEDEAGLSFTDGLRVVFDGDNNVHGTKYFVFLT